MCAGRNPANARRRKASMIYGWIVALIFVFFFNLWPQLIATVPGQRAIRAR
jgi:hypothetical protein